jgi:hypothetical protein
MEAHQSGDEGFPIVIDSDDEAPPTAVKPGITNLTPIDLPLYDRKGVLCRVVATTVASVLQTSRSRNTAIADFVTGERLDPETDNLDLCRAITEHFFNFQYFKEEDLQSKGVEIWQSTDITLEIHFREKRALLSVTKHTNTKTNTYQYFTIQWDIGDNGRYSSPRSNFFTLIATCKPDVDSRNIVKRLRDQEEGNRSRLPGRRPTWSWQIV